MIIIASVITWPEAFLGAVGLICVAVAFVTFMIAATDSKWPWEK